MATVDPVTEYLSHLQRELIGVDAALAHDALVDAETHLRAAIAAGKSPATAIEEFGSAVEFAKAYAGAPALASSRVNGGAAETRAASPVTGTGASTGALAAWGRVPVLGIWFQLRAWSSLFYFLAPCFLIGLATFVWVVTVGSLAIGTLPIIIGLPLAVFLLGSVRAICLAEGKVVEFFLGTRMPHRVQPVQVVLMELELWPGFMAACRNRGIPVAIVNARLSERSFRRYLRVRGLLQPMFSGLRLIAAQSPAIAERLRLLGARPDALQITGSIKFDGAECRDDHPGLSALRAAFRMEHSGPVLVAGSTQEPEEQLILDAWQQLLPECPELTLILVPRHRERFDAVAELVQQRGCSLIRRSAGAMPIELSAARDKIGRAHV